MGKSTLKYYSLCTVSLNGSPIHALYVGHNTRLQGHIFLARNPDDESNVISLRAQEAEQNTNTEVNKALTKLELNLATELMQAAGI